MGYLPEERGLYKRMRVRDLLAYYARLKGFRNCRGEIDQWLERFDLADWARRRVDTLSKGMAQKVQFISAVVARPRLLVLDEPFTGLDPLNMEVLKDAVVSLHRGGTTVIFSTHDMDIAERMCDTVFMICRGRKVLDGTLESIQAQYGQDTIRVRAGNGGRGVRKSARRAPRERLRALYRTAHGSRKPIRRRFSRSCCAAQDRAFSIDAPLAARHFRTHCRRGSANGGGE